MMISRIRPKNSWHHRRSPHTVTVREALSDLPKEISEDDGPLPYPKKPGGRYSEYQKLMRLDWVTPLLASERKRGQMNTDALHNHHTKEFGNGGRGSLQRFDRAAVVTACHRSCGTELVDTNGGVSTRRNHRTPFLRKCIEICRSGSIPSMIGGSRYVRQRGCSLFTTDSCFSAASASS